MKKKAKKRRGTSAVRRHDAGKKIRIGYLSDAFGRGAERDFLPALFAAANPLRFELYAYHTGLEGDTVLFEESAAAFRTIAGCTAQEAAQIIRRDAIDLLVDLSLDAMPTFIRAVFALHPARRLLSLAENRPAEGAAELPTVDEEKDFVPLCYTPIKPRETYVYRTPLRDGGAASIGFVGRADEGLREEIVTLLCALLARVPCVRLILPVSIGGILTDADFARISETGADTAELILVDEVAEEDWDSCRSGASLPYRGIFRAAAHGNGLCRKVCRGDSPCGGAWGGDRAKYHGTCGAWRIAAARRGAAVAST